LEDFEVAVPGGRTSRTVAVDLRLAPGELVALQAAATVSTAVARGVVGLAPVRRGRVLVGRRDVTTAPPADRQVGYVPAHDSLLPALTVERNIWYGLPPYRRGPGPARRRLLRPRRTRPPADRQVHDRMELLTTALDLAPTLHLRPHELDPGQRFHATVVRAVARLHEVLVVDLPRAVPGALILAEAMDRLRAAVPPMATTAVLACTPDPALVGGADRTVPLHPDTTPGLDGP
jgi:ABC-type sugar transport system ATPase subunit